MVGVEELILYASFDNAREYPIRHYLRLQLHLAIHKPLPHLLPLILRQIEPQLPLNPLLQLHSATRYLHISLVLTTREDVNHHDLLDGGWFLELVLLDEDELTGLALDGGGAEVLGAHCEEGVGTLGF